MSEQAAERVKFGRIIEIRSDAGTVPVYVVRFDDGGIENLTGITAPKDGEVGSRVKLTWRSTPASGLWYGTVIRESDNAPSAPPPESKSRSARDPDDIAEEVRRCGLRAMMAADMARLREHFARVSPVERVKLSLGHGDCLAEPVIDRVWEILNRRPTRAEYKAIARMFEGAARYCEREAKKVR